MFCVWDRSQKRAFTSSKGRSTLRSTTRPLARLTVCHCLFLSAMYTHTHTTRHSRRRKNAAKRISAVPTLPSVGGGAPIPCSRPTRSTDPTVVRSIYGYWLHNPTLRSGTCGTATSSDNSCTIIVTSIYLYIESILYKQFSGLHTYRHNTATSAYDFDRFSREFFWIMHCFRCDTFTFTTTAHCRTYIHGMSCTKHTRIVVLCNILLNICIFCLLLYHMTVIPVLR